MRFLKRAAKNIYRSAKSVVRRVPTSLWVAGLTFFTAGLGTAGFGAFAAAKGQGLSGFLGAVGQTTMAGAQGIMGAVGLGQGLSENLAGVTGAEAGSTLFGGNTGAFSAQQSRTLNNFFSGIQGASAEGADQEGAGGGAPLGKLTRQALLMSGIQAGAQAYLAHSAERRQDQRTARLNFFGGPARGSGTSELPFEIPSLASAEPSRSAPIGGALPIQRPPPSDFVNQPINQLFAQLDEEDEHEPIFMRGLT